MRVLTTVLVLATLAACATSRPTTPRQYLDEETAATVTVVADPWIFFSKDEREERSLPTVMDDRATRSAIADRMDFAAQRRDLVSLYAIDVNRMGDHRQYLAVQQTLAREAKSPAAIELHFGDQNLVLQPVAKAPRELGIARPPADANARGSQWNYYAIDKDTLATIARSHALQASLLVDGDRVPFEIWRDGSAELSELSATLRQ